MVIRGNSPSTHKNELMWVFISIKEKIWYKLHKSHRVQFEGMNQIELCSILSSIDYNGPSACSSPLKWCYVTVSVGDGLQLPVSTKDTTVTRNLLKQHCCIKIIQSNYSWWLNLILLPQFMLLGTFNYFWGEYWGKALNRF